MAKMTFNIRIGRTVSNKTGTIFDSRENAATKKVELKVDKSRSEFSDKITELLKRDLVDIAARRAKGVIAARVEKAANKITRDIRQDLVTYTRAALRFFFSRDSSARGNPLMIQLQSLNMLTGTGSGFKSAFFLPRRNETILWEPLAKSTLARGRKISNKYFVQSGKLKSDLEKMLPDFFMQTLNPGLRITYYTNENLTRATTKNKKSPFMQVEAIVATSNIAGMSSKGASFLKGEIFRPTQRLEPVVLRNYLLAQIKDLQTDIILKLENAPNRHDPIRHKRPFIEPMMAYWVLIRFPTVLEQSLKKHVISKVTI